jgi:FKBP-type peptidyl-prolyl cis-trans isomerase SlyD
MQIASKTVAAVNYVLEVEGQQIDQSPEGSPLTFLVGSGMLIPGFENSIDGLIAGDAFDFEVTPDQGYGDVNPEAIVDLSKDVFKVDGELKEELLVVGAQVPMQDENGNPLNGMVVETAEETVKVDFNHPLAGKKLHFSGSIESVREASAEELDHGHVHGDGGVHH